MKKLILFFAAAFALVATSCAGSGNKSKDPVETQQPAENEAATAASQSLAANGLPVVVDFSAEWCPPCRQLKPIFAKLKEEYAGKVDFITVNVDSLPDLSNEYGISSIPALVYLSPDGKEVYRSIGFQEASQIKTDISRYLKN